MKQEFLEISPSGDFGDQKLHSQQLHSQELHSQQQMSNMNTSYASSSGLSLGTSEDVRKNVSSVPPNTGSSKHKYPYPANKKQVCSDLAKRKHVCPLCGKKFPTPAHLQRHMYSHTGQKPFVCPFCQKGHTQKSNLKKHLGNCKRKKWIESGNEAE